MSQNLPTPIPIGSPHVANPPTFEPWTPGAGCKLRSDQRDYARRKLQCELWLIDAGAAAVFRCKTEDISDAGLLARAPVGYGIAVGQRYELRIAPDLTTPVKTAHMAPSLGYGTVTRTKLHVGDGGEDVVRFAVRFDVPQLLPV